MIYIYIYIYIYTENNNNYLSEIEQVSVTVFIYTVITIPQESILLITLGRVRGERFLFPRFLQ